MDEEKKNKKKRWSKITYYGLLAFFGLVFLCSVIYIADYMIHSAQAGNEYSSLQGQYSTPSRPPVTETTQQTEDPTADTTQSGAATDPAETTGTTEPAEPVILEELLPFYQQNPHLVGWISQPGSKLNYPVVQSPEKPNYYLNHTFEGRVSDWGAIYVREECDVFKPSDNITIYGHHMKDGSMFASLDKYRHKSYWQENQYIYFDTLYERHTYQVIAAFKTSANEGEGFSYHLYDDFASEEEFNTFIETAKKLGRYYYDTGVTAAYGDKLITLSTCEYTLNNGRFVVIAKLVA